MNKNVPNIITMLRIILVAVFIKVFFSDMEYNTEIAVIIFVIAGISDLVDGYIARKYNLISNFGKIMDPVADKLMQLTVSICIATLEPKLTWVPIFLVVKELCMLIGASTLFRKNNIVVKANLFGKLASSVYFIVFFLIMLFPKIPLYITQILCSAFVTFSVIASIVYLIDYLKISKAQ